MIILRGKNEAGVTLVELLVAVAIMSIILVPILTLMSNSYSRTVQQGADSQVFYFAQEIIEEIKYGTRPAENRSGYCNLASGCLTTLAESAALARYSIEVQPYQGSSSLLEVRVLVSSLLPDARPAVLDTVIQR